MPKIDPRTFYQSHRSSGQRGGEKAPVQPHLAVRVNETSIAAIAPGSRMFIVRDPAQVDGVFELIFEKVKFKQRVPVELHFIVPSDKPSSTRKCIMTIAWMGSYESWLQDEAKRAAAIEIEARKKPNPNCALCHGLGIVTPDTTAETETPCSDCWTD